MERGRRPEVKVDVKTTGLTWGVELKLVFLSERGVDGIPSVAVECVGVRRNNGGGGGHLGLNWR